MWNIPWVQMRFLLNLRYLVIHTYFHANNSAEVMPLLQELLWVWSQPMRDAVTIYNGISHWLSPYPLWSLLLQSQALLSHEKWINLLDIYHMNCLLSKQECAHEINFLRHAISWKSYIMNLRPQSNVTNVMYMTEGECICICTCKINTFLGKAIWLTRIKQSQTNITSKKADIKPILYTGTLWGELFWIARK